MIDIIIATCDRIHQAIALAKSLLNFPKIINKVIVVDSTIGNNGIKPKEPRITIVKTKHQNQPYQRFLGFKASSADFLIFVDDDMEIIDHQIFNITINVFKDRSIAAIAYNFNEKHSDTSLSKVPGTIFNNSNFGTRRFLNFITGYPNPRDGEYGLCGCRGHQPKKDGLTKLISGGAFAVKREAIYKDFNFQLFDLYEKKLGKGEDGILGYTIFKQGRIFYLNKLGLLHNDQKDSIYTTSPIAFARRVAFSRLYLSLEKCRLDRRNYIWARLHYHYYMFWRILGLAVNYILRPGPRRGCILKGTINGWRMAFSFAFDKSTTRDTYWHNEAQIDLL
jgi:hypothetical protein